MAQKKTKHHRQKRSIMGRSDIPYAQRMAMQHNSNIVANRNHAAKVTMFCICGALHEVEGIGYKRLVRYSLSFKELLDEIYEDIEVGLAHAKHRLAQHGMPISGELYAVAIPGATAKEQQIHDHALQASQIAQIVGTITMNDEFGFGEMRMTRILEKINELSARYAKEGEGFLIEMMKRIGFPVVNGTVSAFIDDDGNPVAAGRALREGYAEGMTVQR